MLLYVWLAVFRPIEWVWIDLSALRISLIAGIILVVPSLIAGILPNLSHPISKATLLFLAAAALAHFGAAAPDLSLQWLDYLGRLVLVCLFAIQLVTTERQFVLLLAVTAGSFGFHTAKAGLASLLGGGVRFYDGLAGSFVDNNGYAVGAAMIIFLLIGTAQNFPWRRLRAAWYLAVPLSALTVVSTFSRAGFLGLVSGFLVFVMLQRRRLATATVLAILVAIALATVPLPVGYADRITTIRTYEEIEDVSATSRLHFWRVAIDMAQDSPFGVGLWNYETNYNRYDFTDGEFGRNRSVHSSHFQVLAETGILGTAAYGFLFGYAALLLMRVRVRARNSQLSADAARFLLTVANALLASMAAFLVGGGFVAMALNDLTWFTFALIAALDRISLAMCEEPTVETVSIGVGSGSTGGRALRAHAASTS